jgi:hypothetical protein
MINNEVMQERRWRGEAIAEVALLAADLLDDALGERDDGVLGGLVVVDRAARAAAKAAPAATGAEGVKRGRAVVVKRAGNLAVAVDRPADENGDVDPGRDGQQEARTTSERARRERKAGQAGGFSMP